MRVYQFGVRGVVPHQLICDAFEKLELRRVRFVLVDGIEARKWRHRWCETHLAHIGHTGIKGNEPAQRTQMLWWYLTWVNAECCKHREWHCEQNHRKAGHREIIICCQLSFQK